VEDAPLQRIDFDPFGNLHKSRLMDLNLSGGEFVPHYSARMDILAAAVPPESKAIELTNWYSDDIAVLIRAPRPNEVDPPQIEVDQPRDPVTNEILETIVTLPNDAIIFRNTHGWLDTHFAGDKPITIQNKSGSAVFELPMNTHVLIEDFEDHGFVTRDAADGVTAQDLYDRDWVGGDGVARVRWRG
jgi:hypothetical protein